MRDILPKVTIKTDTDSKSFMDRIEKIAIELNRYKDVKATYNSSDIDGSHSLTFKPTCESLHEGLVIRLTTNPEENSRIIVNIAARDWTPDPPTYEAYVQAIRDFVEPLIREYNRRYNSRRRLAIQSREDTEPKLPPRCAHYFERFVNDANKSQLHPLDWDRFYLFVRFAHRVSLQLNEYDIKRLLWLAGFSEEYAGEIADVYYHGRLLLKKKLYWYHFNWNMDSSKVRSLVSK